MGIIEAKAIHKDIPSVIDYQGKDYPRCIREEDEKYVIGKWGEFKVPFTFATMADHIWNSIEQNPVFGFWI